MPLTETRSNHPLLVSGWWSLGDESSKHFYIYIQDTSHERFVICCGHHSPPIYTLRLSRPSRYGNIPCSLTPWETNRKKVDLVPRAMYQPSPLCSVFKLLKPHPRSRYYVWRWGGEWARFSASSSGRRSHITKPLNKYSWDRNKPSPCASRILCTYSVWRFIILRHIYTDTFQIYIYEVLSDHLDSTVDTDPYKIGHDLID